MSSHDNDITSTNITPNNVVGDVSGPSSKTFHYVSLPRVVLERIDDQVLPNINTKKSHNTKKPMFKKPTAKSFSQKLSRRNSPRINSLPEKRRIKLTKKGEDTLHIIDFRGNSNRQFIMEDQDFPTKLNSVTVNKSQIVVKNTKPVQKPLLTVRSKAEINKLAEKKLNSKPISSSVKRENTHVSKNLQNTSVVQLNKNGQNKEVDMISRTYVKAGKGNSTRVNKTLVIKRKVSPNHAYRMVDSVCTEVQLNRHLQNKEVVSPNALKRYVSIEKQNAGVIQVNKNLHQKEVISPKAMKHNIIGSQVNKNLQNKQNEVGKKKPSINIEKVVSPTQNRMSMSKEILCRDVTPNSVQGPSSVKRKLPDEHDYHNTKVLKLCENSDSFEVEATGTSSISNLINNTKVSPDRKTAKVIPLAKARKSITLPKPDVAVRNEKNNSELVSSRCRENLEAVTLLSKLVGKPIPADKMEVLLHRESDNRQILINKTPSTAPSKTSQGISHLSKLLSDSLKPSTSSEPKTTTTPTESVSFSSPLKTRTTSATTTVMPVAATTTTTTTTNAAATGTNTTVKPTKCDPGNMKKPPISCDPMFTNVSTVVRDSTNIKTPPPSINTKTPLPSTNTRTPSPSTNAKTPPPSGPATQEVAANSSADIVEENDGTKQQSPPSQCEIPSLQKPKTIYDVMREVSITLPAWNIHILEDTNTFCLACVARNHLGVPTIAKCVELDEEFNARVYIHQYHCKQFDGVYNSETSIWALLKKVDMLKTGNRILSA